VTAALVIVGIGVNSSSDLDNSAKVSIEVLLGTLEVVFISLRIILRTLRRLARDSLTVIPRDGLTRVLYRHLDERRTDLLDRVRQLTSQSDCELEKEEMYSELIGLTDIVAGFHGGHLAGTISAISSTNIEDFDEEPLAEAYLDANGRAVARHVIVRRLFLIDHNQAGDRAVKALIRRHHAALTDSDPTLRGSGSGVRWMLKSHVPAKDQNEDFAVFALEALVVQGSGGQRYELTQDLTKIERAVEAFHRLWDHDRVKEVSDLD
jgi:hypothetical protein